MPTQRNKSRKLKPLQWPVRTTNKDYDIEESLTDLVVDVHVRQKNRVLDAVLKYGASRWYPLGIELGYSNDEINRLTHDKPDFADKLLALFFQKVEQIGHKPAEEMLLDACRTITQPIIGVISEAL